jgi:hypothetical protein
VVVFDGSGKLRSLPGAVAVLRERGQAGVYCLCLDAEERLLPAECQAVAAAGPDGVLVAQQMNESVVGPVRPEYVTAAWAERVARSMAPIRDVSGDEDGAGCRVRAGCWTCSAWNRRRPRPSPPGGGRAAGRPVQPGIRCRRA